MNISDTRHGTYRRTLAELKYRMPGITFKNKKEERETVKQYMMMGDPEPY